MRRGKQRQAEPSSPRPGSELLFGLWLVDRQCRVLWCGRRIEVVPAIIAAVFLFGFRAGKNLRHV